MPRIDMQKISRMIDETPFITELQKDFYKTVLVQRKEKILDASFEKLQNLYDSVVLKLLQLSV